MPHRLDENTLINVVLLKKFVQYATADGGDGRHYAVLQRSNGEFMGHDPHSPELPAHQMLFAQDVLKMLNRELNHSGAWTIVFTHPEPVVPTTEWEYTRFRTVWMDRDGDPKVALSWEQGETEELDFHDVLISGLEAWCEKCEHAWLMAHEMERNLELTDNQLIKAAQGQRPAPSRMH